MSWPENLLVSASAALGFTLMVSRILHIFAFEGCKGGKTSAHLDSRAEPKNEMDLKQIILTRERHTIYTSYFYVSCVLKGEDPKKSVRP